MRQLVFFAARFLPRIKPDLVWESIVLCWSSVCTGLLGKIMVNEGSQFRKIFVELAALHDVKVEKSGVESHNSLGVGERYHKPLRDTYRKLKLDCPSMQRQLLIVLAVKSMNGTLGPEGIVPWALFFGDLSSLRSLRGSVIPRPSKAERAEAAQQPRRYMTENLAKLKVKRAIHYKMLHASDRIYQPEDEVLVWSEKLIENRIGEWLRNWSLYSYDYRYLIKDCCRSEEGQNCARAL